MTAANLEPMNCGIALPLMRFQCSLHLRIHGQLFVAVCGFRYLPSAFRCMLAQVLSDVVKLKRLERCRALLRSLTVNKVKQVFFTDEKNVYLNPPVSKSVIK